MNILDQKPSGPHESLWLVSNPDGTREVVVEPEKANRGGVGYPWGWTYRAALAEIVRSMEDSVVHWLRFHETYLKGEAPTAGPLGGRTTLPAVHFVSGAHTYTAYIGTHHKGHFLGFGGSRVTITMADGRVYESNNLWSGRDVPPRLRDVLRDNATIKWH